VTTKQYIDSLSHLIDGVLLTELGQLKTTLFAEMAEMDFSSDGKLTKSGYNQGIVKEIENRIISKTTQAKMKKILREFGELMTLNSEMYEELGYDVNEKAIRDLGAVKVVQDWTMTELGGRSKLLTANIKKAFHKSIFGNQSTMALIETIGGKWDYETESYRGGELAKFKSQAFTIANTGLVIADRKISNAMANDMGIEWFRPRGPSKEKIIRPFCYAVMALKDPNSNGKLPYSQSSKGFGAWFAGLKDLENEDGYLHIETIKRLKNSQKGMSDTLASFGGWNCRHTFRPARFLVNRDLMAEYPEQNNLGVMSSAT